MQWPGDVVIGLLQLRYLSLDKASIRPSNLRAWMAKMPSLEDLRLHKTRLCEYVYHGWRCIFDAVGDHPRRTKVWFDPIITYDAAKTYLDYHTGDYPRV